MNKKLVLEGYVYDKEDYITMGDSDHMVSSYDLFRDILEFTNSESEQINDGWWKKSIKKYRITIEEVE